MQIRILLAIKNLRSEAPHTRMGKTEGNPKAQLGRERKAQREAEKKHQIELKKQALEDLKWQEGTRDTSKKDALLHKKQEKLGKKQEREEFLAKEEVALSKAYSKPTLRTPKAKSDSSKADQFSNLLIKQQKANTNAETEVPEAIESNNAKEAAGQQTKITNMDLGSKKPLSQPVFSASTLDDALFVLGGAESTNTSISGASGSGNFCAPVERHPERRMKAAYKAYEEQEMPKLKEQNPTLKHSQLKELLAKNWKKSPLNPFNQEHVQYDTTKMDRKVYAESQTERKLEQLKM